MTTITEPCYPTAVKVFTYNAETSGENVQKEAWKGELERSLIKLMYQETKVATMVIVPLNEHKTPIRQALVRKGSHWKGILQTNLRKRSFVRHCS